MLRLNEDYETACRVLLGLIYNEHRPEQKEMLLYDFVYKSQHLPLNIRHELNLAVASAFAPTFVQELTQSIARPPKISKPCFDISIVTIIEEELSAVKLAFGIGDNRLEDDYIDGLRCWKTTIQSTSLGKELNIVVTMIGEAHNVPCSTACSKLFNAYDVEAAILVGIAAGLKGKVRLGDVVAAEFVYDYEPARLEATGRKQRPDPVRLDVHIERDLNYFNPMRTGWHENFMLCFNKLKDSAEVPKVNEDWKPKYHKGVVIAGAKLIADDKFLPRMQAELHERVRAGEQEGSGFARICREYSIPWLVFRGISDYGDTKKGEKEPWRMTAALSAATAAAAFLQNDYRKPYVKF